MAKIHIIDVTNRDGVQTSRLGLAKLEKTILNLKLANMGVYRSEFGFPLTNHEVNYLNANLELAEKGVMKTMMLSGWLRAMKSDVEAALKNCPKLANVNLSISTSKQMIDGKFQGRRTKEDILNDMVEALVFARERGLKNVGVNAEDGSRTDMDYLIKFGKAAHDNGATTLRYCDTLGYDDAATAYDRIKTLAKETGMPIELHFHNDLGMGVACSVAGAMACIDAGVDAHVNTTVNGIGERAGNADFLATVLAIRKSSGTEKKYASALDDIDLTQSYQLAKYMSYAFQIPLAINQVGVGANAFAHESGIHADGALKDSHNYELYDYTELGRGELELIETGRLITTGEYGGVKGFIYVLDNLCKAGKFCVKFKDEAEASKLLDLVRYANLHTQKPLTEEELKFVTTYPEIAQQIMTVTPRYC